LHCDRLRVKLERKNKELKNGAVDSKIVVKIDNDMKQNK
jgi:hypothetical protein